MKKLLSTFSLLTLGLTSVNGMIDVILNKNININKKNILNDTNQSDLEKLTNWHNGLTLSQDTKAKQEYLNAMNITTTKATNGGFDKYNITFDNSKLKTMLSEGLLNQDAYNIISSKETSTRLTNEANTIINIPTKGDGIEQVRAFKGSFYIKDNKMYFINQKKQNLNINKTSNINDIINVMQVINEWFQTGLIKSEQSDVFIQKISSFLSRGATIDEIEEYWEQTILQIIYEEEMEGLGALIEELLVTLPEAYNQASTNTYHSKYVVLNNLLNNWNKIKSENDKYHTSVQEIFYYWGLWIDTSSIKAIPPINKFTTLHDKVSGGFEQKGETIVKYYNFDTLISYSNYDSLWQYLNSNVSFDLGKKFESSVGNLKSYKDYNYTFDKSESSSILKPYLNQLKELTSVSWTNSHQETSSAELDLQITDNPWNKTIYFNFKSTLCNINTFDSVDNWMY